MSDQPAPQQIEKQQGTRLDETPPWMSYAAEFETKSDKQLEAEVAAYAQNRYESTSSQTKEELCRQKELSDEMAKQYQFLTPSEYANDEARIGRVMHSSEFITKLRNDCNVRCWYQEHPHKDKATLLVKPGVEDHRPREIGCWVQLGYMQEFSSMRFDEHGTPLSERRRGWRTCLLQLILKGFVSEETVRKAFGEATGPAATRYNRTLYGLRNEYKE